MLNQRKELNFEGQNIYIGIDVHLKSWTVTILTETMPHKTFTQPPQAQILSAYLNEHFPNADYYSEVEAGFCGFSAHYHLQECGINNIVINPSDVPTSQKEKWQKNDPVDSRKIARALRSKELIAIHVPDKKSLSDRSLIRMRSSLVKDMTRFKLRLKSLLYFYGIRFPKEFENSNTHWSKRFIKWLREDIVLDTSARQALDLFIKEVENQRILLLEVNKKIRHLCKTKTYKNNIDLLQSIPGIGITSAIVLMTHIETIDRFKNTDYLASYVGLIPNSHSSGESENKGEMTFRGQNHLKAILVESSWVAVRVDPALSLSYNTYIHRMQPNKAIIRIARKLLNRIYYVLKNQREYVCGVVN